VNPVLARLVDILALERLETTLFRGQSQDLGWGAIFGGQVVGQALSAASQTVPENRTVHSLHSYFLHRGDASKPVIYDVDCIRDGRSFTTRRVVAIQGGRAIFNLSASFQVEEEGYDHAAPAPDDVREPEGLLSELELVRRVADKIPPGLSEKVLAERPIELRVHGSSNPLNPEIRPAAKVVWMRAVDSLPDDPALHRYLLAYASDFQFLTTALQPHGASWLSPKMQVASIDHAMWFHRPFRMDEWLLHVIDSPSASGARGLVQGRVFNRQGLLVATTTQEGLLRRR
jgi:acyl-CoA thioesterase-2